MKPSPDPLRTDPVATVIEVCVGCGLCGEVAHAAVLCPSFYRAEIVRNATWRDRALFDAPAVIGWFVVPRSARRSLDDERMRPRNRGPTAQPSPQWEGSAAPAVSDGNARPSRS